MKKTNNRYIEMTAQLTQDQKERILSRMAGKLPNRIRKEKLTEDEAIAIQLELEDEQLDEWRERIFEIRKSAKPEKSTRSYLG